MKKHSGRIGFRAPPPLVMRMKKLMRQQSIPATLSDIARQAAEIGVEVLEQQAKQQKRITVAQRAEAYLSHPFVLNELTRSCARCERPLGASVHLRQGETREDRIAALKGVD